MKRIYTDLHVAESEFPVGCGYHFCVYNTFSSVTAHRTKQGFENYLERTNLKPEFVREFNSTREGGHTKIYKLIGEYAEEGFWSLSEIPAGAKTFKGLSNGYYVDCFYADINGIRTIFRPNPNAKEVYKPIELKKHLFIASQN